MSSLSRSSRRETESHSVLILFCILTLLLGTVPVLFNFAPLPAFDFFRMHPELRLAGKGLLWVIVALGIIAVGRVDTDTGTAKLVRYAGFVLVAALLTDVHYFTVDIKQMKWQIEQYGQILAHTCHPPDQYRFVPQGTLWWLNLCQGDFVSGYLAYRFFFTFLVCLAIYKFAHLYLPSRDAALAVLVYAAFYPLSTRYYFGNLLDPMSHAVMIATLRYCRLQKFQVVFWLFVLGVFIKETMLVMAPCYWLMSREENWLRDRPQAQRAVLLGLVGVLAFLLCRMPFGFQASFQSLNRTPDLMIYANLGLPGAQIGSIVPLFQRYLHPVLFIFMWLPLIIWRKQWLEHSLFRTAIYFAVVIYVVNLLFGWNYESRNFIPPFVVLVVCTLVVLNRLTARAGSAASP